MKTKPQANIPWGSCLPRVEKIGHTPGPWKTYPEDGHGAVQVGAIGMAVCEVYPDRDWSTTKGVPCTLQARRDADARLIAAAPDLLAALAELTLRVDQSETADGSSLQTIAAHAALSKALGGGW